MRAVICWSIVLAALIAAHFVLLEQTAIPNAVQFSNHAGLGVDVSDVLEDNARSYSARVTAHGTISTQTKSANTELVYANTVSELHMLIGMFPSAPGTAVVSEDLAVGWFFSYDILGAEISINGEAFNICGVYRGDAGNAVYLNLSSYPDTNAQITELWMTLGNELPRKAIDELAMSFGKRIYPAKTADYQSMLKFAEQSREVLWFFLGISAAFALLIEFGKQAADIIRQIRASIKGYTPVRDKKQLITRCVWCAVFIIAAVVIIRLVLFEPYFPLDWVDDVRNAIVLLYAVDVLALVASAITAGAVRRGLKRL